MIEKTKEEVEYSPVPTDTMVAPVDTLTRRYLRVFSVVCLYWFVSITMVFVNKVSLCRFAFYTAKVLVLPN